MSITKKLLLDACPQASLSKLDLDSLALNMNKTFAEFSVFTTNIRKAAFIAQTAHESGNYCAIKENLNYSKEGLLKVFPKYFNAGNAGTYARNPEKIANKVYANRMGNGDELSGDGWKYRGRGLIQLTGKTNYILCGAYLKKDLINDPLYLESIEGATRSAAWFWVKNNINKFADANDIKGMTKAINGGYIGIEHRTQLFESAKKVLN